MMKKTLKFIQRCQYITQFYAHRVRIRTTSADPAGRCGIAAATSLRIDQLLRLTRPLEQHQLNSIYVKKLNAPPRAPDLTKRMTSTHSFMSFGVGRASGSMRKVKRIRMSIASSQQHSIYTVENSASDAEMTHRFLCGCRSTFSINAQRFAE